MFVDSVLLGAVMALAMAISFVFAGVPVLLKRLGADPAIASSRLVITRMDVIAFFSFLALATVMLL